MGRAHFISPGDITDIFCVSGMIPLHYAAWQGKSEPVHILLQWKSPGNELAMGGESPLHLACQHGHFDVVSQLYLNFIFKSGYIRNM